MYKKVESGGMININTLKQEMEQEYELSRLNDTIRDINPYRELLVNDMEKVKTVLSQMKKWLILSDVVNYVQYDKDPKNFHNLNISTVNEEKYKRNSSKEGEEKHVLDLDFGDRKTKWKIFRQIQKDTIRNIKHYWV